MTPINYLGYGVTGLNMAKEFSRKGIDYILFTIGRAQQMDPDLLSHCFGHGVHDFDSDAPFLRNYQEHQVLFPPGNGAKVAWPFFEVDKLTNIAVSYLSKCDAVACGSEWIKSVIAAHVKDTKLFIAPQGVDTTLFSPREPSHKSDNYRFFSIGKMERRKSQLELIDAFLFAFPNDEPVQLWLMCANPFTDPNGELVPSKIRERAKKDPRVKYLPRFGTHEEVAQFINNCDCGVFPTRGEGWGLPLLETLACSKPLITTNVTSQRDYLEKDAYLEIKVDGKEPALDPPFFNGNGNWYKPNVESMAKQMREAYSSKWMNNPEGRRVAMKHTWSTAASIMKEQLESL